MKNKNTIRQNQRQKRFHVLNPLAITVSLCLIFFFGNAWTFTKADPPAPGGNPPPAQNNPPQGQQPDQGNGQGGTQGGTGTTLPQDCRETINALTDTEFPKYLAALESIFANKSSTNSLLDAGMKEYAKFSDTLNKKLDEFTAYHPPGQNMDERAAQLAECQNTVSQYIDFAEQAINMRTASTASVKRSTALLEKYKSLNAKLRGLNLEFLKMKANLTTFSQKLPCYLRKSCNTK